MASTPRTRSTRSCGACHRSMDTGRRCVLSRSGDGMRGLRAGGQVADYHQGQRVVTCVLSGTMNWWRAAGVAPGCSTPGFSRAGSGSTAGRCPGKTSTGPKTGQEQRAVEPDVDLISQHRILRCVGLDKLVRPRPGHFQRHRQRAFDKRADDPCLTGSRSRLCHSNRVRTAR